MLDLVNASASPAEASDGLLADHLRESGSKYAGFSTSLSILEVSGSAESGDAAVTLTAASSGYEERNAAGAVAGSQPSGPPQELSVRVVREAGRWWIWEILAVDSSPAGTLPAAPVPAVTGPAAGG